MSHIWIVRYRTQKRCRLRHFFLFIYIDVESVEIEVSGIDTFFFVDVEWVPQFRADLD